MASKRSSAPRGGGDQSDSDKDTHSSPYIPPPPDEGRRRHQPPGRRMADYRRDNQRDPYASIRRGPGSRHHHHRDRGYSLPREKAHHSSKLTLLLSVYSSTTQRWHTAPVTIDANRADDCAMWGAIRSTFRSELQSTWKRWFGFTRVMHIMPLTYTANGIPLRSKKSPSEFVEGHAFMHAYHHPDRLHKGRRFWVDWFERFEAENARDDMWGLEFIEGLWADKLAALAIALTVAIIVISVVWVVKGGELQTVFTVMSFVLGGVTAQLALVALYYQVTSQA